MKPVPLISYFLRPKHPIRPAQRAAFTLVELLVVIGIIALLVGILVPVIVYARKQSYVTRTKLDIRTIEAALDAYKQDCGDIPRWPTNIGSGGVIGSQLLGRALLSPGSIAEDGADGFGFRMRPQSAASPQGKVYGPYLPPGKFQLNPSGTTDSGGYQILDRNGTPFLYLPHATTQVDVYSSTVMAFDFQNASYTSQPIYAQAPSDAALFAPGAPNASQEAYHRVQMILGDTYLNGYIVAGETPVSTTAPFLIWAAGVDGKFGFPTVTANVASSSPAQASKAYLQHCDDILNVPWAMQQQ
jgi:prepilin-type N-terminal cleavage/methylation domain-containing protein